MTRRNPSMTQAAIGARQKRFDAWLKREEEKFHAEIKIQMDKGLSFEEAWSAAGGVILQDEVVA